MHSSESISTMSYIALLRGMNEYMYFIDLPSPHMHGWFHNIVVVYIILLAEHDQTKTRVYVCVWGENDKY